jgi:hypothetical protein
MSLLYNAARTVQVAIIQDNAFPAIPVVCERQVQWKGIGQIYAKKYERS